MQEKLVFDMSPKLVSKIEASGGSQNCTLESSFAAVQFAHDSSSRIVIYSLNTGCSRSAPALILCLVFSTVIIAFSVPEPDIPFFLIYMENSRLRLRTHMF